MSRPPKDVAAPVYGLALHTELISAWYRVAEQIRDRHGTAHTRENMTGLADPIGPRPWGPNDTLGYKVFLVYFLPVGGQPVNHHLSVVFGMRGNVVISGGSHRGDGVSVTYAWRTVPPVSEFDQRLRDAARLVGLLPEE